MIRAILAGERGLELVWISFVQALEGIPHPWSNPEGVHLYKQTSLWDKSKKQCPWVIHTSWNSPMPVLWRLLAVLALGACVDLPWAWILTVWFCFNSGTRRGATRMVQATWAAWMMQTILTSTASSPVIPQPVHLSPHPPLKRSSLQVQPNSNSNSNSIVVRFVVSRPSLWIDRRERVF